MSDFVCVHYENYSGEDVETPTRRSDLLDFLRELMEDARPIYLVHELKCVVSLEVKPW